MFPILLIEDNPADVEQVSRFLRRQSDLLLRVAATGAEALDLLERGPFSCVLLDYRLPDTNGLEFLQVLRSQFPELKVIFLTGHEDDRLFLSALRLGASACIPKGELTESLLLKCIREPVAPDRRKRERVSDDSARLRVPPYEVYQTLVETMSEGVLVVDPNQIIVFANPRVGELAGCPALDLFGRQVTSLLPPGSIPHFLEAWNKTMRGEICRYESEILTSALFLTPVQIGQTPAYRKAGEIYGGLLMITDVRRQKEKEEAKSAFFKHVSHELKTPLNAIVGYTSLLLDGNYGKLPEKAGEATSRVYHNAQNLNQMISDLLTLSQVEAETIGISVKEVDLAELLREIVGDVQPLLMGKPIEVLLRIEPNLPLIKSDWRRIREVFLNLLSNAVKYTLQGTIQIIVKNLPEEERLRVDVADTGIGMRESDLTHLFEEFYRINNPLTRNIQGTGLGLAIVKKALALLQGSVEVKSVYSKGSTFTVFLPLQRAGPEQGFSLGKVIRDPPRTFP